MLQQKFHAPGNKSKKKKIHLNSRMELQSRKSIVNVVKFSEETLSKYSKRCK